MFDLFGSKNNVPFQWINEESFRKLATNNFLSCFHNKILLDFSLDAFRSVRGA